MFFHHFNVNFVSHFQFCVMLPEVRSIEEEQFHDVSSVSLPGRSTFSVNFSHSFFIPYSVYHYAGIHFTL
jgi:hypothetical protein